MTLLLRLLLAPLLVVQIWQAVISTYLALVAAASFFYRRYEGGGLTTYQQRFLTLIPAHNVEALLGRLLASLDNAA